MSEKKDWKLFQEKLPLWQERYMARLNQKYIAILEGEGMPSDKFHALDQEIRKDRRAAGVSAELSKDMMFPELLSLLSEGAVTMDDLSDFSDELKECLQRVRS